MTTGIDHIGIAVQSLENAVRFYEQALGLRCVGRDASVAHGVRLAVLQAGAGTRLELLEPTGPTSPVHRFLLRRGEGIHHIALATTNLADQLRRAREAGAQPLSLAPVAGAGGSQVAFLHPKSAHGVLVELLSGGQSY